jgi:CheY-like chemotaxis protein
MSDGPVKILHVDDDEANRYAVTRSLVKAGFILHAASIETLSKV